MPNLIFQLTYIAWLVRCSATVDTGTGWEAPLPSQLSFWGFVHALFAIAREAQSGHKAACASGSIAESPTAPAGLEGTDPSCEGVNRLQSKTAGEMAKMHKFCMAFEEVLRECAVATCRGR
uniref:Secreted protein n=1 Tax=Chrysotila carterae TaxID=13221 RepID=A0A7S4BQ78_CHRCT